ncbi:hypothetical protein O3P69_004274 [Scylla paramamosain]|uniref:Uncharacterized protein n=1 Tax=Scylla paramamosain TaxID=85552 RepID=A0AAW0UIT6_SCYPA
MDVASLTSSTSLSSNSRLRKTGLRCMVAMIQRLPGPLYRWATWCRRVIPKLMASHRYRAVLLVSLIMGSVLVLSVPIVPEKIYRLRVSH